MKILVTGGQGFLGGALVRALCRLGKYEVTATARRSAPELLELGAKVLPVDLRDREAAMQATAGQDLIFHTAARAGVWGSFDDYFAINVAATGHLLEGARQNGVSHFVYTSSPSVTFAGHSEVDVDETAAYSKAPLNAYCMTKIQAERAVLALNSPRMQTMALRPHLIYGPGDPHLLPRVFAAAQKRRLIRVGDGTNRVDITHIDDAVAAHLAVLERLESEEAWGRPYFITSGQPILLWDWLSQVLAWHGLPPIRRSVSLPVAAAIASTLEFVYRLLRLKGEPRMTKFSALQLGCCHTYNIEAARRLLGYQPKVAPYDPFDRQFVEQHLPRPATGSTIR